MMLGFFSIDDFFAQVKEGVDEMIKFLANEPSVGLFFLQQHANTSMPYLLNLKANIEEKVHDVTLHTEDIEDSADAVRSMTEHGFPISDGMINDINTSLHIMSTAQPKRGFLLTPSWGFQLGRSTANPQEAINHETVSSQQYEGTRQSYLSSVFNSAKQKAAGLRWSQHTTVPKGPESDELATSMPSSSLTTSAATPPVIEGKELPLLTEVFDEQLDAGIVCESCQPAHAIMLENFDKFKNEQEAKLEEWLEETESRQVNDGV